MHDEREGRGAERAWSRLAAGGFVVALAAAVLTLGAALGYRTGLLALGASFTALRWGAYAGAAALAVSLAGAAWTVFHRRQVRGLECAVLGVVIGAVCYGLPARQQAIARSLPPIHDITTDTDAPPAFVAVLPLRADAPNSAEYDPGVAQQQRDAYPDLTPILLDDPPARAFERALEAARGMGWELVGDDAAAGRIEATDTTFWYGFKDDVVVRVRPAGGGSRVDVRSVSRVGRGDVGANARRIRAYRSRLAGD